MLIDESRTSKVTDEIAVISVVLFLVFVGGLIGWFAKGQTTYNKTVEAAAVAHFAQAELYQKEFAAFAQSGKGKR